MSSLGRVALESLFFVLLMHWAFLAFLAWVATWRIGVEESGAALRDGRVDVLIPAHNEELGLPGVLASLQGQTLGEGLVLGRVLVVADHCQDQTAAVARRNGAEVLERDSGPPGKPGALRAGLEYLQSGGSALLVLDADARCEAGALEALGQAWRRGSEVVQGAFMFQKAGELSLLGPASWGLWLKNVVRPCGLSRLGLPCPLQGSGMLLSYTILSEQGFEDHLVEDVRLSGRLWRAGIYPRFVRGARITSWWPEEAGALSRQRMRWEGGQLQLWRWWPRLACSMLRAYRWRGLAGLADLAAPPLTLELGAWTLLSGVALVGVAIGAMPVGVLAWAFWSLLMLGLYLLMGIGPQVGFWGLARGAGALPGFLLWKLRLYLALVGKGAPRIWQRTPRAGEVSSS